MDILTEILALSDHEGNDSRKLELISKLENDEALRISVISGLVKKIRDAESHKEYNISLEEYSRIIREKNIEDHLYQLFLKDIAVIKQKQCIQQLSL